jgi:hypothetical protein
MSAAAVSSLPSTRTDTGPLLAHWRGERPLAASFWWRFAFPLASLGLAVDAVAAWIALDGSHLRAASVALLLVWPLLLALATWGGVGAWRAAGACARQGGALLWTGAARVAVALAASGTLAAFGFAVLPQLGGWLQLAAGGEPLGSLQVRRTPDGRRLQLHGPLGRGAAAHVAQALAGAPATYLVELDSTGGRRSEARAIAKLVRAQRLQTRVVGECHNACVEIFMAGRGRQVTPAGHLGLQRQASGAVNPLFDALARRWLADNLRRAGLPQNVVAKTLATSPSVPWVLATDELAAAELVGVAGRPLDIQLPPPEGAALADYAEPLTSNAAWRVLEAYRAGTIDTAAQAMLEARVQGADDAATQVAAQRVVEALLPGLVRDAGPALREQYLQMLLAQLQAARSAGADACRQVLAGDAAARYTLPAPWPAREAAWLVEAAAELAPAPPRALSELEAEVVRRALGENAGTLLAAIRHLPRRIGRGDECERADALLADVMRMPAPKRRLAMRLVFERR